MTKKSVLMCCFYFPPFARSGGMRALQFSRGLAKLGWDVEVLTADPGLYASEIDPSSTVEGYAPPPGVRLTHVRCPRPERDRGSRPAEFVSTLLDPWLLEGRIIRNWVASATAAARQAIALRPDSVIYVGAQPYAAAAIGLALAREKRVPWLFDLSDPWTLDEARSYRSFAHYRREASSFVRALKSAGSVIANTLDAGAAMTAFVPEIAGRLDVITFGYDRFSLPANMPAVRSDDATLVLTHLGAIEVTGASSNRRNPIRYRPVETNIAARGSHYLLEALQRVRDTRPELFRRLRVKVISTRTDNELAAVRAAGLEELFSWTGVMTNEDALRESAQAHALLLLQQGGLPGHRLRSVRAKTYEYMALGRPILACVPEGDGRDIVERYGRSVVCDPADAGSIAAGLISLFDRYREIAERPLDAAFVGGYEWESLTRRLDANLTKLATGSRR